MKAKIEKNGEIKRYSTIPKNYRNIIGFDKLADAEHRKEGFFDVVFSKIDNDLQERGEIFFDESKKIFSYPVVEKILDIKIEREEKLNKIHQSTLVGMKNLLSSDVIQSLLSGETISSDITDKATELRTKETTAINYIDQSTDAAEIRKYKPVILNVVADIEDEEKTKIVR
jgi:isopenicillin N synthase-like dioxygenase